MVTIQQAVQMLRDNDGRIARHDMHPVLDTLDGVLRQLQQYEKDLGVPESLATRVLREALE